MSCRQLAEKFYVKSGDPRAAIEMYTKANMYEAAHKVTNFIRILSFLLSYDQIASENSPVFQKAK